MSTKHVVMAGFGGQGLMMIGKLLAKAAMDEGRHCTWIPSYGPEMRGGTANCTVVVDEEPIGSPVVRRPGAAVVMNNPSMDKFEPTVAPGGFLVVNSTLIERKTTRADLEAIYVPANAIAEEEGSGKAANMVMLGAYAACARVVSPAALEHAIEETFADKPPKVAAMNVRAFRRGWELVEKATKVPIQT